MVCSSNYTYETDGFQALRVDAQLRIYIFKGHTKRLKLIQVNFLEIIYLRVSRVQMLMNCFA